MRKCRNRYTEKEKAISRKLNREAKYFRRLIKKTDNLSIEDSNFDKLQLAFENYLKSLDWVSCKKCKTKVLCHAQGRKQSHKCKLFQKSNDMDPGVVPPQLCGLSYVEKQLIARIHPVISLYRIKGQQFKYSGNIINFTQDVQEVANVLPPLVSDVSSILTFKVETVSGFKDFQVRRKKVYEALLWLKENNELYRDIKISEESLLKLPVDGNVYNDLKGFDLNESECADVNIDDISKGNTASQSYKSDKCVSNDEESDAEDNYDQVIFTNVPFQKNFTQGEKINNNFGQPVLLWPSIGKDPINEFSSPGYISLAFPHLFPFGRADYSMPRPKKVFLSDYIHHLMTFHDQRFAQDERFRYFMMNSLMRWNCLNAGAMFVQKNSFFSKMTVLQLKDYLLKHPMLVKSIMFYNSRIRSTRPYWNARCSELLSMVEELGPPTVFFTLSSADFHWPDLYRLLGKNVHNLSASQKACLISENPLLFNSFFYHRSKFFIENILKKHFNITDYWYRYEYQHRGSVHCHAVAWFKDCPDVDNLVNLDHVTIIRDYFDDIVCCENPGTNFVMDEIHPCSKNLSEVKDAEADLVQLVNRVQRHSQCSVKTCLRKTKGQRNLTCRFNFPFELREETEITAENGKISDIIYKRNDPLINRFNSWLIQTWRANVDISGIVNSSSVYRYIAKYASKTEIKSVEYCDMLKNVLDRTGDDNVHCKKLIRKLLISSCSERDYCAQEVMHFLMSHNFYKSSREFVVINLKQTNWDQVVHKRMNSFIESYSVRPSCLYDKSLFYVAQNYKLCKNEFILRPKKAIVRIFPKVIKKNDVGNELYYDIMCKCHIPWDIESGQSICTEENMSLIDEMFCSNASFNETDSDLSSTEDSDSDFCNNIKNDCGMSILSSFRPIKRCKVDSNLGYRNLDKSCDWTNWHDKYSESDLFDDSSKLHDKLASQFVPDSDPTILNNEQMIVYRDLKLKVQNLIKGEKVVESLCIVQGSAGCGKSYLLSCMVQYVCKKLGIDSVRVLAPTGVAAKHIHGITIHSYLKIGRSFLKFSPLVGDDLRNFQLANENLKFLFIDEYSMVGCRMLAAIEQRCREMKDGEGLFGNLVVYLFGDISQLMCVGDVALFRRTFTNMSTSLVERGSMVVNCFQKSYIMKCSQRFSNSAYIEFLNRLSVGLCSMQDWSLLKSRCLSMLPNSEQNLFKNCVRVCATNDTAAEHNEQKLIELRKPIAILKAENSSKIAMMCTDDAADGLLNVLMLSVGAKVMLKRNINVSRGLVNSSVGFVVDILYDDNCHPPSLPKFVLVQFCDVNLSDTIYDFVVLRPNLATWYHNGVTCTRLQYPLSLAWACTIHKTQSLTLERILLDMDTVEFQLGLTYVALSRVTDMSNLALLKCLTLDRMNSCRRSHLFHERMMFLQWLTELL